MVINRKKKGNRAERAAIKPFNVWTGKEFARVPASGGLNWRSKDTKGDIICSSEGHYFPFAVEIKHHADIDFSQLLIPNKKVVKVRDFWLQTIAAAKDAEKVPLLLMRYNGLPKGFYFVVLDYMFFRKITLRVPLLHTGYQHLICPPHYAIMTPDMLFTSSYRKVRRQAIRILKIRKENGE